jgi:hypothetical protein
MPGVEDSLYGLSKETWNTGLSSLKAITPDEMLLIDLFNNQEGSKTTEVKFITWTIGL